MHQYIIVTDGTEEDALELPVEEEGCVLQSTLNAQYPNSTGLKYKPPGKPVFRALKCEQGKIWPDMNDGWGNNVFTVVFPKADQMIGKRKLDEADSSLRGSSKMKKGDRKSCDLIVLGLPFSLTSAGLKEHFEQYGEMVIAEVKFNESGKSKGFGFIRFADYESQLKVMGKKHQILERVCEVRIPNSQKNSPNSMTSPRIFVGRVPENLTNDRMRSFFEEFGEVSDVYIPRPCRGFAFVTFYDPEVAERLIGEDLAIDGHSVHIGEAAPKSQEAPSKWNQTGGPDYGHGGWHGGKMLGGGPPGGSIAQGIQGIDLSTGGGVDNSSLAASLLTALTQQAGGGHMGGNRAGPQMHQGGPDYSSLLSALSQVAGGAAGGTKGGKQGGAGVGRAGYGPPPPPQGDGYGSYGGYEQQQQRWY